MNRVFIVIAEMIRNYVLVLMVSQKSSDYLQEILGSFLYHNSISILNSMQYAWSQIKRKIHKIHFPKSSRNPQGHPISNKNVLNFSDRKKQYLDIQISDYRGSL
jgi:predicted nucleotidyltransferase